MRDYKKLTSFPREDKAVLVDAAEKTGLSINQLIVEAVHEALPSILARHNPSLDLSPIPDKDMERYYAEMSAEEIAEDNAMGRASLKAQKAHKQ